MANKRSLNRVILVGNVGREPEITHIPSLDKDVAKFSMVTTEVFMDKTTNEWKENAEWHNIVAWGWNAKKVERNIHKGSMVLVEGKIKSRKWKDKNDQDRWTTEIAADVVISLDKSSRESMSPGLDRGQAQEDSLITEQKGGTDYPDEELQAPPEAQIDDVPYDEGDPF